jgi:hypothetical protein
MEDPAYEFIARYATIERIFAELKSDLSGGRTKSP